MESLAHSIERLPESCVAHALSLTSPRDACRAAPTSTTFRRAADADTVWDRFLPSDLPSILSRAADPARLSGCSSKKEFYLRLCDHPVLIDDGETSFELDKCSGKKCFTMSARGLTIIWGDTPEYWRWVPSSDSRFSEVAHLVNVCWLEIRGKINARLLSPRTTYCAFLVYKIASDSYGLSVPSVAATNVGTYAAEREVVLELEGLSSDEETEVDDRWLVLRYMSEYEALSETEVEGSDAVGEWKKMELGEFFVEDGEEGDVDISVKEVETGHWKKGLVVQGIEVRPMK